MELREEQAERFQEIREVKDDTVGEWSQVRPDVRAPSLLAPASFLHTLYQQARVWARQVQTDNKEVQQ